VNTTEALVFEDGTLFRVDGAGRFEELYRVDATSIPSLEASFATIRRLVAGSNLAEELRQAAAEARGQKVKVNNEPHPGVFENGVLYAVAPTGERQWLAEIDLSTLRATLLSLRKIAAYASAVAALIWIGALATIWAPSPPRTAARHSHHDARLPPRRVGAISLDVADYEA
jgi:hypothetical protein